MDLEKPTSSSSHITCTSLIPRSLPITHRRVHPIVRESSLSKPARIHTQQARLRRDWSIVLFTTSPLHIHCRRRAANRHGLSSEQGAADASHKDNVSSAPIFFIVFFVVTSSVGNTIIGIIGIIGIVPFPSRCALPFLSEQAVDYHVSKSHSNTVDSAGVIFGV
ncbi:hypothetical protein MKZ38_003761 [Zalerion maritima]|uniref:Uncharacterized protein n=1 Tax=Zalerion maritima TaxID=339359 RepID=A0AAD5RMG9_9PEZI|nr:hypothetical protein MKZ38_003761 [Zalerion maritima]